MQREEHRAESPDSAADRTFELRRRRQQGSSGLKSCVSSSSFSPSWKLEVWP